MDTNNEYNLVTLLIQKSNQLWDYYNSENYILGMHNVKAYKLVAVQLFEDNVSVKPVIINGESKLGKSHLLHAIIREFRNEQSKRQICYLNWTTIYRVLLYMSDLRQPDIEHSIDDWFGKYDIFVLEDLDDVIHRTYIQDTLYEVLKYWKKHNKKVFISTSVRLQELDWITEALKQYFEDAMEEKISNPDYHVKIAFLKQEIASYKESGFHFEPEVLRFVAMNYGDNFERLKKSIQFVLMEYQRGWWGDTVTVEAAENILEGLFTSVRVDY